MGKSTYFSTQEECGQSNGKWCKGVFWKTAFVVLNWFPLRQKFVKKFYYLIV